MSEVIIGSRTWTVEEYEDAESYYETFDKATKLILHITDFSFDDDEDSSPFRWKICGLPEGVKQK